LNRPAEQALVAASQFLVRRFAVVPDGQAVTQEPTGGDAALAGYKKATAAQAVQLVKDVEVQLLQFTAQGE
jgi:hypothetical protein